MNKEIIRRVLTTLFTLLLIVSIVLSFGINLIHKTILSKEYIKTNLGKSDYYNKLNLRINNEFEGYLEQSGFDSSILDNVYSNEDIIKDTDIVLDGIYKGLDVNIDLTKFENNLNNNINKYIEINNINLDLKQKESISLFVSKLKTIYENNIHSKEITKDLSKNASIINTFLTRYKSFINAIPIVLILLIILVNITKLLFSFKFISLALLSSSIFGIATYFIININNINKNFSNITYVLIEGISKEIITSSRLFLVVALLLTFVFIFLENHINFKITNSKILQGKNWILRH